MSDVTEVMKQSLILYCVFAFFWVFLEDYSFLKCCMSTKPSQIVCIVNTQTLMSSVRKAEVTKARNNKINGRSHLAYQYACID